MPNQIPAEVIYEGDPLRSPTLRVLSFRAVATGTIKAVYIWGAGAPVALWYWNMRVAGVGQWSGSSRLLMTLGDTADSKTGLSIAVMKGDRIDLDLEATGGGQINAPVQFLVVTEETV